MCKIIISLLYLVSGITYSAVSLRVTEYMSSSCSLNDRQQFACPDGVCLDIEHVCDGIYNCFDGSDEARCDNGGSRPQSEDLEIHRYRRQSACRNFVEWQCEDGTCIPFHAKCNKIVDCPDRSDEARALCRKKSTKFKFECDDGSFIQTFKRCDGTWDCPDRSDETFAECANNTCSSYLFQCAYGGCVEIDANCNGGLALDLHNPESELNSNVKLAVSIFEGTDFPITIAIDVHDNWDRQLNVLSEVQDCPDGSDESDELCNRMGTPEEKLSPLFYPISTTTSNPTSSPKPARKLGYCILPPYPDHGTYEVSNLPSARPGQSFENFVLTVSCQRGYGLLEPDGDTDGNSTQTVYCLGGLMYQTMPECVQFCKLDPNPSVRYMCQVPKTNGFKTCKHYVAPGTIVNPVCNTPNYYSTEILRYMKCVGGSWDYIAQCKAECGRVTPEGVQLVVGGQPAKRGELPWHVGIYRKTSTPFMQICGGSLVSNNVVLSAAHCFWNDLTKKQPASNYAVAAGKLYRPWDNEREVGVQKSDVKEIIMPSLFLGSAANFQEDLAIVILVTPFVYQTYVRPVCLNFDTNFERLQLVSNKLGKVAGWGLTEENGNASQILKVVDMPYINIDTCVNKLPPSFREYITGDKICAGYTNGTALCMGDSGGGLAFSDQELRVERYYLRGVVSTAPNTGNLCNAHTYTLFTKITKHEDLIKEYL